MYAVVFTVVNFFVARQGQANDKPTGTKQKTKQKNKKSETELTASVLKKDPKHTRD